MNFLKLLIFMSAIALNKSDSAKSDLWELMDKVFCLVDYVDPIHFVDCVIVTDAVEIIKKMDELLKEMREISASVKDLTAVMENIRETMRDLPDIIDRDRKIEELQAVFSRINDLYTDYESYLANYNSLNPDTLDNFASDFVRTGKADSGIGYLRKINSLLFDRGLVEMTFKYLKKLDGHCVDLRSHHQELFQIYSSVLIAEFKGHIMMEFSYKILRTRGKGNYTTELKIYRSDFEERSARASRVLKDSMKNLDRTVWRCDPAKPIEGDTYHKFNNMFLGVVELESKLNYDGSCSKKCEEFSYYNSSKTRSSMCEGNFYNCLWRSWVFEWKFQLCYSCDCICDDSGRKSERFISLKESVSNVASNMVVTGIRFLKKNSMVHLQVQEGELMKEGKINTTNVAWVPVPDFHVTDKGIESDKDYYHMNIWTRHLDLDDLEAPTDHIITGVRFQKIEKYLNFQMRASKFDYKSGKILESGDWMFEDHTELYRMSSKRPEIELYLPDVPTKTKNPSKPMSVKDSFIKFTFSDLDKDGSQTTVPFLDGQIVTSEPPVPLSGAGIFFKGERGFGGYITPRIKTFDYTDYL